MNDKQKNLDLIDAALLAAESSEYATLSELELAELEASSVYAMELLKANHKIHKRKKNVTRTNAGNRE